ncbi:hypothetical protein [Sinorhizobium meliloti]|uniref:hypothetical protein n=1 Tax=Rhizobium meliloti TaxID=382 RepID=UPI0013E325AC|nr:hypothetical protein [Sinorhizobium meliloti]
MGDIEVAGLGERRGRDERIEVADLHCGYSQVRVHLSLAERRAGDEQTEAGRQKHSPRKGAVHPAFSYATPAV